MASRVYFAFDYEDVSDFRANVVRNHNFVGGVEKAGYFDSSIWEEAKKKSDLALKRMINAELENTSVTAVLIGSGTWARRWVRYEIIKSIARGNRLLGIHINSIADKNQATKPLGPNPFDNLGLSISKDGRQASPTEWKDGQWQWYKDLEPFTIPQKPEADRARTLVLSHWYPTYDWVAGNGYDNFTDWIL